MENKKQDSQIVKLRKALQNAKQKKKVVQNMQDSKEFYDYETDMVQRASQYINCPLEN